MAKPILDRSHRGTTRLTSGEAAGPADYISSQSEIDQAGILVGRANNGRLVDITRGDGRRWNPILDAVPQTPQPGDTWLQTVAPGVEQFAFCDAAGNIQYLSAGAPVFPTPVQIPLSEVNPTQIASVLVDQVGLIEWSIGLSNPVEGSRTIYWLSVAHDGTLTADAQTTTLSFVTGAHIGQINVVFSVSLVGSGPTQTMQVFATTNQPDWSAYVLGARMVVP